MKFVCVFLRGNQNKKRKLSSSPKGGVPGFEYEFTLLREIRNTIKAFNDIYKPVFMQHYIWSL